MATEAPVAAVAGGEVLARPAAALHAALRCPLCKDLLRGAYTAPDCMHTYCWACVSPWVSGDEVEPACPVCRAQLGRDPLASGALRFDRALTALCRTVFPRPDDAALLSTEEARADEARRRREANGGARGGRGAPPPPPPKPRRRAPQQQPAARLPPSSAPYTALPSVEAAVVAYEVRPVGGSEAPPLEKPFLRSPPSIPAAALQRYIAARLGRGVRLCGAGGDVANEAEPLSALLSAALAGNDVGDAMPRLRYCLADA